MQSCNEKEEKKETCFLITVESDERKDEELNR